MSAAPPLWDPHVLERVGHLRMLAGRVVDGVVHGAHLSTHLGANVEFADYKEYSPGDTLRHIDWRVFARSDRLVVKRFRLESEMPVVVVLDASGDMSTGDSAAPRPPLEGNKYGYAVTLAASLLFFLFRQGEPIGLKIVGGEGVEQRWFPPRHGRQHLAQLFGALAQVKPGGVGGLGEAFEELAGTRGRRTVAVVVSDFMEPVEGWRDQLTALTSRRHELIALHVMDEAELTLEGFAPSLLFSPEGGTRLEVDPEVVRPEFLEEVRRWRREVREAAATGRGRYLPAEIGDNMTALLMRLIGGGA